jgi:hypothetical protein
VGEHHELRTKFFCGSIECRIPCGAGRSLWTTGLVLRNFHGTQLNGRCPKLGESPRRVFCNRFGFGLQPVFDNHGTDGNTGTLALKDRRRRERE